MKAEDAYPRLFRIFFQGQDHFFSNKMEAKEFGLMYGLKGVFIHLGPDHWRSHGN